MKEKALNDKMAKESGELDRQKDSIEKEKKDLESQRVAIKEKEAKLVKTK